MNIFIYFLNKSKTHDALIYITNKLLGPNGKIMSIAVLSVSNFTNVITALTRQEVVGIDESKGMDFNVTLTY